MNLNDPCWVRLNDLGRKILLDNYLRLVQFCSGVPPSYRPHPEINGWAEFQLWVLMHEFGQHLWNGCNPPFETMEVFFVNPHSQAEGKQ